MEKDNLVLETLRRKFKIKREIHLDEYEKKNQFLEGTGSIVFDHEIGKAYMCLSKRSSEELFKKLCQKLDYTPIVFRAHDEDNRPIYHTNVMMSITSKLNIVCLESLYDEDEDYLLEQLDPNKEVLIVDTNQMNEFCCNVLEVSNKEGQSHLVMSTRALNAFEDDQIELIERYHKIIHAPLTTIEKVGGGGARCMMAEVFL